MTTTAEIDAEIVAAARETHNAAVALGEGSRRLISALNAHYQAAFRNGGAESAEDFLVHASPERVRIDIVGLLMACGLGQVLVQAAGRQDWAAVPDFFQRYEALVESGTLTAHRGQPNADQLSGYAHPGVRVHERPSTGPVSPQGKVI